MAFYCQSMLQIALILTDYDPMYEEIAYRFLEHFILDCLCDGPHWRPPRRDVG